MRDSRPEADPDAFLDARQGRREQLVVRHRVIAIDPALSFAGLVTSSGFTSVHMLVKTELFPTRIRALAVSLPYALTTAVLGGPTKFVTLRFKASGHERYFYWYVAFWATMSLCIYIRMAETRNRRIVN